MVLLGDDSEVANRRHGYGAPFMSASYESAIAVRPIMAGRTRSLYGRDTLQKVVFIWARPDGSLTANASFIYSMKQAISGGTCNKLVKGGHSGHISGGWRP